VEEIEGLELREILFRDYRIIYRLAGNTVVIVGVFHGSKALTENQFTDL
jgi:plasmid stabilization system protein ParE